VGGTAYAARTQATGRAWLALKVPADAVVYLQNQRMTLTGTTRSFYSTPLPTGKEFLYTIKVEVNRGGKVVSTTSQVTVRADRNVQLTFTEPKAGAMVASVNSLGNSRL
jgi:uncharacterized protein (TIGR03000 family)